MKWLLRTNVRASISVLNCGTSRWKPMEYINLHLEKKLLAMLEFEAFPSR
jgi:hypothetical protein